MTYAEKTRVAPQHTRQEIETLLIKKGAIRVGFMTEGMSGSVIFDMHDRRVRFTVRIKDKARAQQVRSVWRALLLCIKAKLASVENGIETFEEAFLAHVVMPEDDRTVYDHLKPRMAEIIKGGGPLLLGGPVS